MSSGSVLRVAAAVMAAIGFFKFSWIFVDSGFDITVSPWGFLLVFVLPFVVVVLLAARHLRGAAWMMVAFGLPTFAFMAIGIAVSEYWLEVILVGYPVAIASVVGVIAAVRTLAARSPVAAH